MPHTAPSICSRPFSHQTSEPTDSQSKKTSWTTTLTRDIRSHLPGFESPKRTAKAFEIASTTAWKEQKWQETIFPTHTPSNQKEGAAGLFYNLSCIS